MASAWNEDIPKNVRYEFVILISNDDPKYNKWIGLFIKRSIIKIHCCVTLKSREL